MDERSRIEKVIEMSNLNSGQFAIQIGVQNSTLSHILNNRNNPSLDVLKKILNRFPTISSDWLILGQGPMLREEKKSQRLSLFDDEDANASLTDHLVQNPSENNDAAPEATSVQMLKSEPDPIYRPSTPQKSPEKVISPPKASDQKLVKKIILYYTDNTFQEFESK